MDIRTFVQNLFNNPEWVTYIILIQFPIVLCLAIQCFQFYKLGFKEFKLISYAWGLNFFYLLSKILMDNSFQDAEIKLQIRTTLDILNMCFFVTAVFGSIERDKYPLLRKLKLFYFYVFALIAGVIKTVLGPYDIINNYVHLHYLPGAIFDFTVLLILAQFFKGLEKKFQLKKALSTATVFYAILQFLFVIHISPEQSKEIALNIDNLGFILGLIIKLSILISLSILMVFSVKRSTIEEKEALLIGFSKASNRILDIEKNNPTGNHLERENIILNLTLLKLLDLLKKDLGYYSSYNEKTDELVIRFTSESYKSKIGYKYTSEIGLTGKAIRTKSLQIMNSLKEDSKYKKFPDTEKLDNSVNSAIAFPLILDDKALGVFMIECDMEYCFLGLDIDIIQSLIYQATVAVKNNRLIHDLEISKGFFDSLRQIDKQIVDVRSDIEPVLSTILRSVLDVVKCNSGNIDIVEGDRLICIASTNKSNINFGNDINDCLSGLAIVRKEPQYFPDLENLSEENKRLYKPRLGEGYKSELIIPLIVNNEVIGVFNTESEEKNIFTKDDVDRIEGLAGQAAIAIYITKLIEDINGKNISLENAIDKRNIEMSSLLSNLINHKIGNEIGYIRITLENEFLKGEYGKFSDEAEMELKLMLECANTAITESDEANEAVRKILKSGLEPINFEEIKTRIERNKYFRSKENITIEINGFDKLKEILVSPYLLMEVIYELFSNAVKAMPDGGRITITGKSEQGFNLIIFQDHGCGIEEEDKDQIFVKGYSKWRAKPKGGGIGLSEVKRIIEFWGGTIEAKSKIGKGTSFIIKLPLEGFKKK